MGYHKPARAVHIRTLPIVAIKSRYFGLTLPLHFYPHITCVIMVVTLWLGYILAPFLEILLIVAYGKVFEIKSVVIVGGTCDNLFCQVDTRKMT